ncbi:GntR family transcriptional regulator [Cryobacterium sp. Y62]|uniref:GntR family transcriptional regulator n=1 Tax=Cryobacterium sp. Y62 TaxID=2048284 RepID=UPI001E302A34|nr:GntR family transcriptional regulator [Cryobacterium sp. Y62]
MSQIQLTGQRLSLRDIAYVSLRNAIVTLKLKPGESATEERLSHELGVSRPIIREAVQQLQAEGLLERLSNGRLRVSPITEDDVNQLYAVRSAIELVVVSEAMAHCDEAAMQLLEDSVTRMKLEGEISDGRGVTISGGNFHSLIFELSHNRVATDVMARLRVRIDRYRHISVSSSADRPHDSIGEHEAILFAFRLGDVPAAQAAMTLHVENAKRAVLEGFSEQAVALLADQV